MPVLGKERVNKDADDQNLKLFGNFEWIQSDISSFSRPGRQKRLPKKSHILLREENKHIIEEHSTKRWQSCREETKKPEIIR